MCRYRVLIAFAMICVNVATGQDRKTKVLKDKEQLSKNETWIYNDLGRATAEARRTGKPLFVVLRCIPCEACSQFDQQLLDGENEVRDLLDKFVCVRIVQANGLDLGLFQFDYDQSFHGMFMNADRTIYGRFGTRSGRPEHEDMTLAGLRQALLGALELHQAYPANKELLAGKQSQPVDIRVPEELPTLKGKYTSKLDYQGKVVQSCIHCHQIRDSEREVARRRQEPMPAKVLFPYPLPDVLGLTMDPKQRATVVRVAAESIAAKAGLQAGDSIESLDGQRLLSTADLQWVLHHAPAEGKLAAEITRGGTSRKVELSLDASWRQRSNISFRPTTWELRRMATGGMLLEDLSDEQRRERRLANDVMALRAKHVGEYGDHAAALRAGFRKEDIIVALGDNTKRLTETDFIAATLALRRGQTVPVKVLRGNTTLELKLPLQ